MAAMLTSHTLICSPNHRLLALRDAGCSGGAGGDEALRQAQQRVATGDGVTGSTGYLTYICAAQNDVPLSLTVQLWPQEPTDSRDGFSGPEPCMLACPTGVLVFGDHMGTPAMDIALPDGAGQYQVLVYHRGRDTALAYRVAAANAPSSQEQQLRVQYEGAEQYLVQMWRVADLPEDDDADEWN